MDTKLVASSVSGIVLVVAVIVGAWLLLWRTILVNIPVVREVAGLPPLPPAAASGRIAAKSSKQKQRTSRRESSSKLPQSPSSPQHEAPEGSQDPGVLPPLTPTSSHQQADFVLVEDYFSAAHEPQPMTVRPRKSILKTRATADS